MCESANICQYQLVIPGGEKNVPYARYYRHSFLGFFVKQPVYSWHCLTIAESPAIALWNCYSLTIIGRLLDLMSIVCLLDLHKPLFL